MHVYMIKASAPSPFKDYKKFMASPPQNIFALAACTPKGVNITMTDETMDMDVNYSSAADIVVVMASTPDANRMYTIADTFRDMGKTVVLGGLHASFLPHEAALHADAVLIGEAEGIWQTLLEDWQNGVLCKYYERTKPVDLATLSPFPTNIISPAVYHWFWTVVVGRGCHNKCSYCAVHPFFRSCRFRPVEAIVEEIKHCGCEWVELHADNLTANREYAIKLFTALKPLNINWMGECTLDIAKDPELLQLAAESGLKYLLVGLETPSAKSLKDSAKGFLDVSRAKEYIAAIHQYDIIVDSAFLFGFDDHTPEIFETTARFAEEIGIDICHSAIVTPFPGTRLYAQVWRENRLLTPCETAIRGTTADSSAGENTTDGTETRLKTKETKTMDEHTPDWSAYDCAHAVYRPKGMTPEELEYGAYMFHKQTWPWVERNINKFIGRYA